MKKSERAALFAKFGGRCAYCGAELGARWHADHVEPIMRKGKLVWDQERRAYRATTTGECWNPEHDHFGNLMPSCAPCNIHKNGHTLESWRKELGRSLEILRKNYSTYRAAIRFGMVAESVAPVQFYFERHALTGTTP